MKTKTLSIILAIVLLPSVSNAMKPMTDDEIRKLIIKGDASKFTDQCRCPFDTLKENNRECGDNSAYFQKPAEEKPKCYPEDVQQYEVNDYRSQYGIPVKP
jgi:hypothetical protein